MLAGITSDNNGINYAQILAYSFLLFSTPLLPVLITSVLIKRIRFISALAPMNILMGVIVVIFTWYAIGMIFIT
jgi:hypothetical protein